MLFVLNPESTYFIYFCVQFACVLANIGPDKNIYFVFCKCSFYRLATNCMRNIYSKKKRKCFFSLRHKSYRQTKNQLHKVHKMWNILRKWCCRLLSIQCLLPIFLNVNWMTNSIFCTPSENQTKKNDYEIQYIGISSIDRRHNVTKYSKAKERKKWCKPFKIKMHKCAFLPPFTSSIVHVQRQSNR